jgi:hypothetical protein
MIFVTKQGDTRTALRAQLLDGEGNPVDLTDSLVYFRMSEFTNSTTRINRQALVQENGEVWFVFEKDEVSQPGIFKAEFHVEYPDGRKEVFPNSGYIKVTIEPSVGGVE